MNYNKRLEIFEKVRAEHSMFLLSVLWKLTGDKELFSEAMQYALLGIWQHIEKLNGKKAHSYIYRIALSANSKAWHNRISGDGHINIRQESIDKSPDEKAVKAEQLKFVRQAIAQLPNKQARAIVLRYLQQQDYQGIADKLRCTEAGARSHVSKALTTLKSKLATLA
jgi:RNA polymerase sigma factor (sigma-70 family)